MGRCACTVDAVSDLSNYLADAKLAAGELTQSQYDAQRVRVLELIRTGRADVSGVRRAIAIVCSSSAATLATWLT